MWKRERVEYEGDVYSLPLPPGEGTGLGKPLELINHPVRERIPVYIASLGHKNVQLTAEIAEGWMPVFFHPDKAHDVWSADLEAGEAQRDATLGPLEIVSGGAMAICDDETAAAIREFSRPMTALYIGGMGAKGKNFYNDTFRRYGYEEEAEKIQDLYLDGKKDEAAALIPDDYLEATTLAGDEGFVRERVDAFRDAGVTNLMITPATDDPLALIDKVKSWSS